jgi:ABC-2 type transport system ATP-binding protein
VAEGTTVLLTTQYMEEAEHVAQAIVVLDAGRIAAQGRTDELKDQLGGNVLEVQVTTRADLDKAASLIAGLASPVAQVSAPGSGRECPGI